MRLNSTIIGGNLTADPESREVAQGHILTKFRIANNYGQDRVSFINVECWGKTAEVCRQYLEKGSGVVVQGELIVDTYEDKEGNKRNKAFVKAHKVEFLPRRAERDTHTSTSQSNQDAEEISF